MSSVTNVTPNSFRAWMLAVRPKTLSAALVPVAVGSAVAAADTAFRPAAALLCLLFALCMQAASNLINDLLDFKKGTDDALRLGPPRACAMGWITPERMLWGIGVLLLAAAVFGLSLIYWGGWHLLVVGALCMLFAYAYTGGPYPLSYHGLGDVAVVVFFGLVAVCGTYYVQALQLTAEVVAVAVSVGLVTDALLLVNNYRDAAQDALHGKRTLVVMVGKPCAGRIYWAVGVVAALVCALLLGLRCGWPALFPLCYLPFHLRTQHEMCLIECDSQLNAVLGLTSRNMMLFGLFTSLGYLCSLFLVGD